MMMMMTATITKSEAERLEKKKKDETNFAQTENTKKMKRAISPTLFLQNRAVRFLLCFLISKTFLV